MYKPKKTLVYHGMIDDNADHPEQVKEHYLTDAIESALAEESPKVTETMVIGCSIKWKD